MSETTADPTPASILPELQPGRRAYLDGLGSDYEPAESWGFQDGADPERRQRAWVAQRARYGFDGRETWSLKTTMIELFYERLKMYLDLANPVIDLDHHSFVFEGVELTQKECIALLISLAEDALRRDSEESISDRASERFWNLWALVHPVMWW